MDLFNGCVSVFVVFLLLVLGLFMRFKQKKGGEITTTEEEEEKEPMCLKKCDDNETAVRILVAFQGFIYDVTEGAKLNCPWGESEAEGQSIGVKLDDDFKHRFLVKNYRCVGEVVGGEYITKDNLTLDESDAATSECSIEKSAECSIDATFDATVIEPAQTENNETLVAATK